jgi:hypothetical protein
LKKRKAGRITFIPEPRCGVLADTVHEHPEILQYGPPFV